MCNGCPSAWTKVTSAVPQGSILRPLLFVVYINDISDNLASPTKLFADDCVIYRQISNTSDCFMLQEGLSRLYTWTQKWLLALNLSKCKAVCISNKGKPTTHTYRLSSVTLTLSSILESEYTNGVNISQKLLLKLTGH